MHFQDENKEIGKKIIENKDLADLSKPDLSELEKVGLSLASQIINSDSSDNTANETSLKDFSQNDIELDINGKQSPKCFEKKELDEGEISLTDYDKDGDNSLCDIPEEIIKGNYDPNNEPSKTFITRESMVENPCTDFDITNEVDNVYMRAVVELYQNISVKISSFTEGRAFDRDIMENCYRGLLMNDVEGVKKILSTIVQTNLTDSDMISVFISKSFPEFLKFFQKGKDQMIDKMSSISRILKTTINENIDLIEEGDRLKNIIHKHHEEYSSKADAMMAETMQLKDGLLKELEMHKTIDSQLEVDLLKECRDIFTEKDNKIEELKLNLREKNEEISALRKELENSEIGFLNQQIYDLKISQKRIQNENIQLTQGIAKLTEKNVKYQKDLVLFNNSIKKLMYADKVKSETIKRQKALVEMFQAKLCNTNYPIENLRRKRDEIQERLKTEVDFLTKQNLLKEKIDCEKRLSDFINLRK